MMWLSYLLMKAEMEFLDILNEKGEALGVKKSREEAHEKGYWHRVVHIWIMNSKGQILIQKRSAKKISDPNLWAISCEGHVSAGASVVESVLKELDEELGLTFKEADLRFLFEYSFKSVINNGTYLGNHFVSVYLIKADLELNDIQLQEDEVSEVKWIEAGKLKEKLANKDAEFKSYSQEQRFFEYLEEG